MLQTISLAEALTGSNFTINHLDKRTLTVNSAPGEVIKPDAWRYINDEGMPVHGRPFEKGNLYIKFTVEFPNQITPEQIGGLKQLLPGGRRSSSANGGHMDLDDEHEEVRYSFLVESLSWQLM